MNAAPVRVVLDCQVFLQAALSDRGPAAVCRQAAEAGVVELCLSKAVLTEVAEVLAHPELQACFTQLTPALVEAFLTRVCEFAVVVDDVPHVFSYARDPDDEPCLDLALAVGATHLVSRDRDLLDLQSITSPDGQRIRAMAPQLVIVDPAQFLATLR